MRRAGCRRRRSTSSCSTPRRRSTPMAEGRIQWIDLDLDFEVRGDDLSLEDEAQFHDHARSMSYPDEVVRGAWSGISGIARALHHRRVALRRVPRGVPGRVRLSRRSAAGHVEDADDGDARLVRRVEVDLGGDDPLVVTGGVRQDLAHRPPSTGLLDLEERCRRGPWRRCRSRRARRSSRRAPPTSAPSPSRPRASSSPSAVTRRWAASSTRRNSSFRTRMRNARAFVVTGGGVWIELGDHLLEVLIGVGEGRPLVEEAGVHLPDQLARATR